MDNSDVKTVVVTGAGAGIGYELLLALITRGYRVAGFDVDVSALRPLAEEHPDQVQCEECDVTDDADVEAAVGSVLEDWGHIDILVNNAAILQFGFFDEQSPEELREAIEVNYFGYVRMVRAVLPHMREHGSGIVHNVTSGVASVGNPGLTAYGSSKGAVESFTRSLRHELRHENVSCTLVQPRLASTESATRLAYPQSQLVDPAYVGEKLATKIESTSPVIYTDWATKIGLTVARLVPSIVERGTERFLTDRA